MNSRHFTNIIRAQRFVARLAGDYRVRKMDIRVHELLHLQTAGAFTTGIECMLAPDWVAAGDSSPKRPARLPVQQPLFC